MNNKSIFAALFAAIIAISCSKEVTPEVVIDDLAESGSNVKEMTFTAVADNALATRTSLNGLAVKWGSSEGIYVFDGSAPRAFVSTNDEEAATVSFSGTVAANATNFYAVYPSGTISGSTITSTIPTFQTATENSFAMKSNVAVAHATTDPNGENVLKFKNVGAIVKFRVANTGITKVRLDAVNGEPLSGKVNVSFGSNDAITATMSTTAGETQSCVIMNAPAAGLATDKDYYFVVAPGNYEGGFRITLFKGNKYKSRTSSAAESLSSNDFMDFGTIPAVADGKWHAPTMENVTVFEETFDKLSGSGGRDGEFTGSVGTSSTSATDNDNWTLGDWGASKCIKLGTGSGTTSAVMEVSLTGDATLTFNAAGWGDTKTNTISVSAVGASVSGDTSVELTNGEWDDYSVNITNVVDDDITITFTGKRGFLDDVKIVQQQESGSSGPADPGIEEASTEIKNVTTSIVSATAGSSASFDVDSNVSWTIAASEDFVSLSVNSQNKVTVTFEALPTNTSSRNVTVTVTPDSGVSRNVSFTQKAASDHQATISFGSGNSNTAINGTSITGNDSCSNTWTIATKGVGDGTPNFSQGSDNDGSFSQVGTGSNNTKRASEVKFTTTLTSSALIKSMSIKLGGFSGNSGTVSLKVGNTVIGSGSVGESTSTISSSNNNVYGTDLTIIVSGSAMRLKVYELDVTYYN